MILRYRVSEYYVTSWGRESQPLIFFLLRNLQGKAWSKYTSRQSEERTTNQREYSGTYFSCPCEGWYIAVTNTCYRHHRPVDSCNMNQIIPKNLAPVQIFVDYNGTFVRLFFLIKCALVRTAMSLKIFDHVYVVEWKILPEVWMKLVWICQL